MHEMRLCMASINSRVGEFDRNLAAIKEVCRDAAVDDADLVCFPELSLSGYAMPSSYGLAAGPDDPHVSAVEDLSAELGIAICFGFVDEEHRITQAIAEGGRIIGSYSKTHLGEREVGVMVPGGSYPIIRTSKANVGISICWEAHFPEIAGTYALEGADIVLMPFASGLGGERRQSSWDRFLPARAYDNTVFVGACNASGDNGAGTEMGGGAAVYDVRGFLLGSKHGGCILTVDLDPTQMDRIRRGHYESMRDVYFLDKRRPELYSRLNEKL